MSEYSFNIASSAQGLLNPQQLQYYTLQSQLTAQRLLQASNTKTGLTNPISTTVGSQVTDLSRVGLSNVTSTDLAQSIERAEKATAKFSADIARLEEAYKNGTVDGIELAARKEFLQKAYDQGTYLQDRTGGALADPVVATTSTPTPAPINANQGNATVPKSGTGLTSNAEDAKIVNVDEVITAHDAGGARLTSFTHSDGSTDDERIGYIKLQQNNNAMSTIASGENKQQLEAIYSLLVDKYNKFIITTVQESRSERSMIMPTVGDSFAATFSGREPMVLAVQGMLLFDYDRTKLSWFHAFFNAYDYYLRASKLAKFRAKMKLVLPDLTEYTGYMLNVGSSLSSENDMVVPVNFSMLVVSEAFNKAYGIPASAASAVNIKPASAATSAAGSSVAGAPTNNTFLNLNPADLGKFRYEDIGSKTLGNRITKGRIF